MAKAKVRVKGENIVFIGKDGRIVIASATGDITVTSADRLSGDLIELMKKRQAAGKELNNALAKAKYPVAMAFPAVVLDPSGTLTKLGKKKTKMS
jgi:hypothetical protein